MGRAQYLSRKDNSKEWKSRHVLEILLGIRGDVSFLYLEVHNNIAFFYAKIVFKRMRFLMKCQERIMEVLILDKVSENTAHMWERLIIEKIRDASCAEIVKKKEKKKNRSRYWYVHRLSPEKIEMFLTISIFTMKYKVIISSNCVFDHDKRDEGCLKNEEKVKIL